MLELKGRVKVRARVKLGLGHRHRDDQGAKHVSNRRGQLF